MISLRFEIKRRAVLRLLCCLVTLFLGGVHGAVASTGCSAFSGTIDGSSAYQSTMLISTFSAGDVITFTHTGTVNYWGLYNSTYSHEFLDYVPPYPVNTYTITASDISTYGTNYFIVTTLGGSGSDTLSWSCAGTTSATTTVLSSSASAPAFGTAVTLTATITGSSPTGTVTFKDGSAILGSSPVSGGKATLTTSSLSTGVHSIIATYDGDGQNTAATSTALTVTVTVTVTAAASVVSRPDPSMNVDVRAQVTAEVSGASRFAQSQIDNVNHRFEQIHDEDDANSDGQSAMPRQRFGSATSGRNVAENVSGSSAYGRPLTNMASIAADHDNSTGDLATGGNGSFPSYRDTLAFAGQGESSTGGFASGGVSALDYSEPVSQGHANQADASRAIQRLTSILPKTLEEYEKQLGLPFHLWTAGSLNFGQQRSDGGFNTSFNTAGLTVGADASVTRSITAGIAFGFGSDSSSIGTDGSRNDSSTYNATAYATWRFLPHSYFDVSLGYGALHYGLQRWSTEGNVMFNGTRNGNNLFSSIGVTHDIKMLGWKFSPYGRVDIVKVSLDGYTENGSSPFALTYDSLNSTSFSGVFGGRAAYPVQMSWGLLTPMVRLEYRHTFDGGFSQSLNYADLAGSGGAGYSFSGVPVAQDVYTGGLSLRAKVRDDLMMDVEYQASGGSQYSSQGARATVRYGF